MATEGGSTDPPSSSAPRPDNDPLPSTDPRLNSLREYVAHVENGDLDTRMTEAVLALGPDDEIKDLGESILAMASKLELRFERERQLGEISREIVQGVFLDDVLNDIYESFKPLIPYDRIGCALLERSGQIARARWARTSGFEPRLKLGFSAHMDNSSLRTIIETGRPRIINDLPGYLDEHPKSASTRLIVKEGIQSSLTCPLIAMGRPVGFLFFSSVDKDSYGTVHQDTFMRLADLVSIAVEKSLLYEQMAKLNQDLIDAQGQLRHQATHDSLTGLLNHGAIIEELQKMADSSSFVPSSESRGIGVLMLDIDNFKSVNDTYGHPTGDTVLGTIAETMTSALRSSDRIGRYGGEEFLVVAEISDPRELDALAERLRQAVESTSISAGSDVLRVTVSIGLAIPTDPEQPADPATLIQRADRALYRAKALGRNRVEVG